MFWGQALIEFRRTNKARSYLNFRAWHLKADSKSAFATSRVGSRSPPLTTSFGISAFDMSRGTHPPTLPISSRMRHFPNRRAPDDRLRTPVSAAIQGSDQPKKFAPMTPTMVSRNTVSSRLFPVDPPHPE